MSSHHCPVFEMSCSIGVLAEACQRVRRNRGGPGGDGQTIEEFLHDRDKELWRLRRSLLDFSYRPGRYRRYPVDKASGGQRWIAVPCVRDRVVQTAAALTLSSAVDDKLSHCSFAYRPGRSVEDAAGAVTALRLKGFIHVAEGDIEAFFDSVSHRLAIDALRPFAGFAFLRLAGLWLSAYNRFGRGLPQGSPLSPVLANLVLDPVDRAVESSKSRIVRYADDFVLMARSAGAAEAALQRMQAALEQRGLRLKAEKTRLARMDEAIRFLGLEFRGDDVGRVGSSN